MRILLSSDSCDSDIPTCANLLTEFCRGCVFLYGKGIITYSIHSSIHLIEDFQQYVSLDLISCFAFESYLGVLKSAVKSGYKALEQVASRVWHSNENTVGDYKTRHLSVAELLCPLENVTEFLNKDVGATCHYKKARLSTGCIFNIASIADSTVQFQDNIAKVVDIFECSDGRKYFTVRKYDKVVPFFKRPIVSSKVKIFLVDKLSISNRIVEVNSFIKKCVLFPCKSRFVSIASLVRIRFEGPPLLWIATLTWWGGLSFQ